MKRRITALAGLLLLLQPSGLRASEETTIPSEIESLLAKGKWLAHVWKESGLDGEKGFSLGGISLDTADDAGEAKEALMEGLGSFARPGAPYQLHVSIRRVQLNRKASAGVSMSVVGVVREASGRTVAAFETTESAEVGGSAWNNQRLAARRIAYAVSRELFPVASKPPMKVASASNAPLPGPSSTAASGKPGTESASVALGLPPATLPFVKGQVVSRVWKDPAFDGTAGFRFGGIYVVTEDAARDVEETLPEALRPYIQPASPYSLYLSILRVKTNPNNNTSASIILGGTLRDAQGQVVAAFEVRESSSIGGGVWNNTRLAVRRAVFNVYKELFPSLLNVNEKAPEIIVPAKEGTTARVIQDRSVLVPAKPTGGEAAASHAVPVKESLSPLFSEEIGSQMKRGKALGKLWVSPIYEKSSGFSLGEVRYAVEDRNDGIDKTLPEELKTIAQPESPFSLQLRIVLLRVRVQKSTSVTLRIQGNLTTADGTVVAAFETQEMITGSSATGIDECRIAARSVVQALAKDLNP